MLDMRTSRSITVPFDKASNGDEWVEFDVHHEEPGVHDLYVKYKSPRSRPVRLAIDGKEMWVSIMFDSADTHDFRFEGSFDLGPMPGLVRVGFRALKEWPSIESFRFFPRIEQRDKPVGSYRKTASYFGWEEDDPTGEATCRWKRSPTAVTFTFEIGIPFPQLFDVLGDAEYRSVALRGRTVKFTYGEAHDCMVIDGDPIGNQYGGENFPKVAKFGRDDLVQSVTLGLSNFTGEAAFHGLVVRDGKDRSKRHSLLVGALLREPHVWVYDRDQLGLNLWLTSICAVPHRPVVRYGFTLSSDDNIDFNPLEFEKFWNWFVHIKHDMVLADTLPDETESPSMSRESVAETMAPLFAHLKDAFSGVPSQHNQDGWIYGTSMHLSLTFDVFSLLIFRRPRSEDFQTILFVDGIQYDASRYDRLEDVPMKRNSILAHAIALAASDTDLLYQMGLLRAPEKSDDTTIAADCERELQPLLRNYHTFSGDYSETSMARRAIMILAMAGLRKVGSTLLTDDTFGWDIYSYASVHRELSSNWLLLAGSSAVCSLIQLFIPGLLIYRAVTDESEALTWDTFIARILFLFYAAFAEYRTVGANREDYVVAWLCFLPEYSVSQLIWGRMVNQISKLITTAAQIGLVAKSFTVLDVALNSLALYYILDLDDQLVNEESIETVRNYQEEQYLAIKSKLALEFRQPWFDDRKDMPQIQELPSRYFLLVSSRVVDFCMLMFLLGILYVAISPWFQGSNYGGFDI